MIISVAWKNIRRNKLRSAVVIFAVIIGIMAGAFAVAIMEGVADSRTDAQLNNEISHIQIHKPEFLINNEAKYFINNSDSVKNFISNIKGVKQSSDRLVISAVISTAGGNSAAFVYGINPETEKYVTNIYKFVKDSSGNYFNSQKQNQVLISETLAKELKLDRYIITEQTVKNLIKSGFEPKDTVKLKQLAGTLFRNHKDFFNALRLNFDEQTIKNFEFLFLKYAITFKKRADVVITFQDADGKITGDKFFITGIYKTSNRMFDQMTVFVNKKDLARLSGYKLNSAHEIAVMTYDPETAENIANIIKNKYPELDVKNWREIDPMLVMLADYMTIYNYLIIGLILSALAFGIVNTMLMAVMERTKEIGMLAAVGMNRKRIFLMIMFETIFLTIVGAITGLAANYLIISHLSVRGIDLSKQMGEAFEAIGYDSLIYPNMELEYYIGITMLVIFTAVLSAIYPAVKALKLKPAEAVRTDA